MATMKTEDFPTSCDLYNTGSDKYTIPYQVDRDYASVPHEGVPDLDLMRNRKYSRVTPVTISSSQHWLHKSVGEIEVETTVKFFSGELLPVKYPSDGGRDWISPRR